MKKIIFILISAFLIIGCATVSNLKPTESDLTVIQQKVPGVNLVELQHGFRLYKYNCSGCHYLHKPNEYTITGWEKVLPEMLGRAKITSEKEQQLIRNYLFAKSK